MERWMKKIWISALLGCALLFAAAYAQTVNTTLTINENTQPIKRSHKGMLGLNETWYGKLIHALPETTEPNPNFTTTLRERDITIFQSRMAGADAHSFRWKECVDPLEERSGSNVGLVEWIKSRRTLNPEAELTFTLNIVQDSLEDHKDLVRFLYLQPEDANAVGGDGVNWAQKRVDMGLKDPVPMRTFEIGNEVYHRYVVQYAEEDGTISDELVKAGVEAYTADCLAIMEAMKSVYDDLSFSVADYSYANATASQAKIWNEYLIDTLIGQIEYVVHHQYFLNYNFYWINQQLNNRLFQYINAYPEESRPKVYMSEYGYWMTGHEPETLQNGTNMYGMLINAKFLNLMLNMEHVERANLHTSFEKAVTDDYWHSGWDVFRVYKDGNIYPSMPSEMLKLFGEALGNGEEGEYVVGSYLDGNDYVMGVDDYPDGADTVTDALTASVHKDANGNLSIVLVNPSETVVHQIQIQSENTYTLTKEFILSGESYEDNNLWNTPDSTYVTQNSYEDEETFTEYTLPALSIAVLKLSPEQLPCEKQCRIKINGKTVSDDTPTSVGREFFITANLIANGTMKGMSSMVAIMQKNGEKVELPLDNNDLQSILYLRQCKIVRDTAYFNIVFPENAKAGLYDIYIGDLTADRTKCVTVSYGGQSPYETVLITPDEAYDGKGKALQVVCSGKGGKPGWVVLTVSRDDVIFYKTMVFDYGAETNTFEILLPKDAISGDYTLKIEKQGFSMETEFVFQGDGKVALTDFVKDSNGNRITAESLTLEDDWHISLKNNSEEPVSAICIVGIYDKNRRMLGVMRGKEKMQLDPAALGEVTMTYTPIQFAEKVDYIKLFLWEEGSVKPLSGEYLIR